MQSAIPEEEPPWTMRKGTCFLSFCERVNYGMDMSVERKDMFTELNIQFALFLNGLVIIRHYIRELTLSEMSNKKALKL